MRRIIYLSFCILCVALLSGCIEISRIREEVTNLQERVTAIEQQCSLLNTNIVAIQSLSDAFQKGDFITSVTPIITDGDTLGYTISFVKGTPITILNGKDGTDGVDGQKPIVGVKTDMDGLLYWTLDEEWLLDESGHKIKAVGTDGLYGNNGNTPVLKIEDGYWLLSIDNGSSWSVVGEVKSGIIKESDWLFSNIDSTTNEYCVSFSLVNGTTLQLPTWHAFESLQSLCIQTESDLDSYRPLIEMFKQLNYLNAVNTVYEDGKVIGYALSFSNGDNITIFHEQDGDNIQDELLRMWLGYTFSLDFAAMNTVLFTDEDVTIGRTYSFSYTVNSVGAIGFYNDDNVLLGYVGDGVNRPTGFYYNSKYTIPLGFKYAKAIWGNLADITVCEYSNPSVISEELDVLRGGVKSYFKAEMDLTIETILEHTQSPSVVLPIITDNHWGTSIRSEEQTWETIENVKYLNNNCYCDGVIHLGDILNQSWNSTLLSQGNTQAQTDIITTRMMSQYLNRYASTHPEGHLYAIGGNHDGSYLQTFRYSKWYSIIGRRENNDFTIVKGEEAPYFYVDFAKCKLRCVFLQQPNDYENNNISTFGYTKDMLDWLSEDALRVKDGVHVVMFSHIPPMQANYVPYGILENRSSFYGLCNAFNSHSVYNDGVISSDFSSFSTSKIICYVCGHCHGDWIYESGEAFCGTAYIGGKSVQWTYENGMPCPVVIITSSFVGNSGDGETRNGDLGTIHVLRQDQTVNQEAWDTFVFNPVEKKIHFIRFGSGKDRIVDLSNVI